MQTRGNPNGASWVPPGCLSGRLLKTLGPSWWSPGSLPAASWRISWGAPRHLLGAFWAPPGRRLGASCKPPRSLLLAASKKPPGRLPKPFWPRPRPSSGLGESAHHPVNPNLGSREPCLGESAHRPVNPNWVHANPNRHAPALKWYKNAPNWHKLWVHANPREPKLGSREPGSTRARPKMVQKRTK